MKKLLLLLLLIPSMLSANVATAVAMRGETFADDRILSQGDEVAVGEHIITTEKSFVVLQFTDGSKITVRPNSEMIVKDYEYPGTDSGVQVDLVSGGLRILTGAISKSNPENYKISTPTALMGVRGTEFSIQYVERIE